MWDDFQMLIFTYQEEKVQLPRQKERFFEDETFCWPEEDHDPAGGVACSPGHRCIPRDFEGNLGLCHSSASHDYLPFKNYFVMVEWSVVWNHNQPFGMIGYKIHMVSILSYHRTTYYQKEKLLKMTRPNGLIDKKPCRNASKLLVIQSTVKNAAQWSPWSTSFKCYCANSIKTCLRQTHE